MSTVLQGWLSLRAHLRWYRGWNIVAACVLSTILVNGLPGNCFSLFLHYWTTELHTRISFLQLGVSVAFFICALIGPLVGMISDRYPARLVFGIGLAAMVIFCIAISYATTAWEVVLLYALLLPVVATCGALIPANALVSRWFVRRLGLALGLTTVGVALQGMIAPPIVAALLPSLGWRLIWRWAGLLIAFLFAPIILFVLRDRPTDTEGRDYLSSETTVQRARTGPHISGNINWFEVLKRPNFWLLVMATMPMLGSYVACMQNLTPIIVFHGFDRKLAGILLPIFSLAHLIANVAVGALSDRLGPRRPLFNLAVLTAVGSILLGVSGYLPVLAIGVVLVGLSGAIWPLMGAAIGMEFGQNGFGQAFGLLALFVPVAGLTSLIVARVQEVTGNYVNAFIGVAALNLLAAGACLLMRDRREDVAVGPAP